MPPLIVASAMFEVERTSAMWFFAPERGGEPLLWQHLFWFFGHPEVYIIIVPALGIVSTIVVAFARRTPFGYTALVLSLVAVAVIGFDLWVHHMFTVGLPELGLNFFSAASVMIAIPSAVQVFCWLATLWSGRPRVATPLLFILGFLFTFVLGGLTGVMVASVPFDAQVHDTYFVVAHFHYMLFGATVFPIFAAVHFWFPKMFGRMLSERMGAISFWLLFVGFQIAFFPMHNLGLAGMPRRVYTYIAELGWGDLNLLATSGVAVMGAGAAVLFINIFRSRRHGEFAGNNPWNADTLEWFTTSPPPLYAFRYVPVVHSLHPLWENEPPQVVKGFRPDVREVLVTSTLDAEPQAVQVVTAPSPWPFWAAAALALALVGYLIHELLFAAGLAGLVFCATAWHRDTGRLI